MLSFRTKDPRADLDRRSRQIRPPLMAGKFRLRTIMSRQWVHAGALWMEPKALSKSGHNQTSDHGAIPCAMRLH